MLEESKASGQRVNQQIPVEAFIHYATEPEKVAHFELELSLKVL